MKTTMGIVLVAGLCALVVGVSFAGGTTFTLTQDPGTWDDPDDWDQQSGFPGSEDTAIIPPGMRVNVYGDEAVKVLKLQRSGSSIGVIRIRGAATLTLHGSSAEFEGDIRFQLPGTGGKLIIEENLTLTGFGSIEGHNSGSGWAPGLIIPGFEGNQTLTIEDLGLEIKGAIAVSVNLVNNGTVNADTHGDTLSLTGSTLSGSGNWWANGGGVLDVETTVTGSGKWVVTQSSGSEIHITEPCTSLTGSVTVADGILDLDADFTTTGMLLFGDNGSNPDGLAQIQVAPGKIAQFSAPAP